MCFVYVLCACVVVVVAVAVGVRVWWACVGLGRFRGSGVEVGIGGLRRSEGRGRFGVEDPGERGR